MLPTGTYGFASFWASSAYLLIGSNGKFHPAVDGPALFGVVGGNRVSDT